MKQPNNKKRLIAFSSAFIIGAAILAGCQKEDLQSETPANPDTIVEEDTSMYAEARRSGLSIKTGADQTITLPTNYVNLDGSGSEGSIRSFRWTKDFGNGGRIESPNSAKSKVSGLTQGAYRFRLKITDRNGRSVSDTIRITVKGTGGSTTPPPTNQAPVVNAGSAKTITLPTTSVSLSGSATDADGTIASYQWSKVSGNGGTISSPSSTTTNVTGLSAGSYVFNLKATDNRGATGNKTVSVTVNQGSTTPPPPSGNFGTVTFNTGYDKSSDVNTNQGPRNSVSTSIKKSGTGSFRSEVRSSDQSTSSGYRGEMQYNGSSYNPTEGVVEYDVYYENWRNFGGGGHSMQWHPNNGTGSATLSLYTYNGKFQVVRNLGSNYGGANYYQSGTLQTVASNKWYNMRWEFKWASSGGYIRLYIDNVLYYSYTGETMNSSTGMPYMKVGQNRWSMPSGTNTVVYYDNLKVYRK
jgi:hypothetical protein